MGKRFWYGALLWHFHITTVHKYRFFVFCLYTSYIYLCRVVMWKWYLYLSLLPKQVTISILFPCFFSLWVMLLRKCLGPLMLHVLLVGSGASEGLQRTIDHSKLIAPQGGLWDMLLRKCLRLHVLLVASGVSEGLQRTIDHPKHIAPQGGYGLCSSGNVQALCTCTSGVFWGFRRLIADMLLLVEVNVV